MGNSKHSGKRDDTLDPVTVARDEMLRLAKGGQRQATAILAEIRKQNDFYEMDVLQAFWQLLQEGKVNLDEQYRLGLGVARRTSEVSF